MTVLLSDVITWFRRIVKTQSDQAMTEATIMDYINRFYIYDMPERLQLFELKRKLTFELLPNIDQYQFDFNSYQLAENPVYIDGVNIGLYQSNDQFYKVFPDLVQNQTFAVGNGTPGPYSNSVSAFPIIRGFADDLGNLEPYVFVTAKDQFNNMMYLVDNGNGIMNQTDSTFQQILVASAGTVNYLTGAISVTFSANVQAGYNIQVQTNPYSPGTPRICLFFNNIFKFRPIPDKVYKAQFDVYVTPSQFLNTSDAIPFAYMAEYLARGAARKALSDVADEEQIRFYEPFFREQENLVLRRTERIRSGQRTPTIFSSQTQTNPYIYTSF